MDGFRTHLEEFVVIMYEYELLKQESIIKVLKNIFLVIIDEINDGNINTFSPSSLFPSRPHEWGYILNEHNEVSLENHENILFILNKKTHQIVADVYRILTNPYFSHINGEDEGSGEFERLFTEINDMIINFDPLVNNRRICKYGKRCFRNSNVHHLEEYSHPWLLSFSDSLS
jgi:hypothetical protein